jgi:hypothetical protein
VSVTFTDTVTPKLQAGRARLHAALSELAKYHASRGETLMKENASWTDRTGNARQGLFGTASSEGDVHTITLGGTMEYQKYLEDGTTRMPPYAVIRPTAETIALDFFIDGGKVAAGVLG